MSLWVKKSVLRPPKAERLFSLYYARVICHLESKNLVKNATVLDNGVNLEISVSKCY